MRVLYHMVINEIAFIKVNQYVLYIYYITKIVFVHITDKLVYIVKIKRYIILINYIDYHGFLISTNRAMNVNI